MRVEIKMRLLRVVAVMMVMVRVAVNRRDVCSAIAIVMSRWGSPYLALLRCSRVPVILMSEAVWVVSPLIPPLLLLLLLLVGRHPRTLVREVTVVASPTNVVMRVVAASLSADRRWCLIGWSRAQAGLLDGSESTLSHTMWRSVTPTIKI